MAQLSEQRAVVTGAARGIGFAIAKHLLADGAAVSVWEVDGLKADEAVASLRPLGVCPRNATRTGLSSTEV